MKFFLIPLLFIFQIDQCSQIDKVRNLFQKATTETDLTNIIEICKKYPCNETTAYLAASTMRMATYYWSPIKKLESFNKGKNLLENHIKQYPLDLEARYIRWMCQKNSPSFLGYQDNLVQDKLFIHKNIHQSTIDDHYKKIILQNIKNHD